MYALRVKKNNVWSGATAFETHEQVNAAADALGLDFEAYAIGADYVEHPFTPGVCPRVTTIVSQFCARAGFCSDVVGCPPDFWNLPIDPVPAALRAAAE